MALRIQTTLRGAKKLQKEIRKRGPVFERAVLAAVFQEGFQIMAASVREVPVKSNRLRGTAYVAPPRGDEGIVEIGYGTDYAVPVHERTEVPHDGATKAKYLKDPLDRARSGYVRRIAARAEKNAKRLVGVKAIPAELPPRPIDRGGK